jgi:restriction endonuclease S subunit
MKEKRGMGVSHINMADLRNFMFPLPPIQEQLRIISKLKVLEKEEYFVISKIEELTEKILMLKQSILKIAFEGNLV